MENDTRNGDRHAEIELDTETRAGGRRETRRDACLVLKKKKEKKTVLE